MSSRVRAALVATVALVAVLVAGGWGLSWSIDPTDVGPARRILVYSGGKGYVERPIEPGSAEEQAVAAWLDSHSKGWHISFVSYAPVRLIMGEGFSLNFSNDFCVLNYHYRKWSGGVGLAQVVRTLRPDETIPDVFRQQAPSGQS